MAVDKLIADVICDRMIDGETIAAICRDPDMPSRRTVYDWQAADPQFRAQCARAREGLADAYEQRMQDVVDGVESGRITPEAARVILANLQWRAAKAAPKSFGDRVTTELSGPDGGPVQVAPQSLDEITRSVIFTLTLAEKKGALLHNEQPGERAGE